jgi:hypothetical protein
MAPYEAASLHEPPDLGLLHESARDVAMVCRRIGNVMTMKHENEVKRRVSLWHCKAVPFSASVA